MSENIDGGGRRSPGPRLLVRPLLLFASVALVIGFVAVRTDVEPYQTPFFRLFFSNTVHMKAWLTTAALLLGLGQLLTAARIYGKLRFPPEGRLYPLLHRWSGRAYIHSMNRVRNSGCFFQAHATDRLLTAALRLAK